MADLKQTPDRRIQRRSRCLNGGRIVLGNGRSTLACRIQNQSETGVRLVLDSAHLIPSTFTLLRGGQTGRTDARTCQLAWRKDGMAGARLVENDAPAMATAQKPGRVRMEPTRYPV